MSSPVTNLNLLRDVRTLKNPDGHIILDATISKEPLGPLTIHGDNKWNDAVSWVVYCNVLCRRTQYYAEECQDLRNR